MSKDTDIRIPAAAEQVGTSVLLQLCAHESEAVCREFARACFLAIIEAWPGAFPHEFRGTLEGYGYVLPIPRQEKNSGEI